MSTIKDLLTERLRPKRFDHLILPKRVKDSLGNGILSQNILLYGSAGIGKTSAAKILSSGSPCLYINISDESSVDVIRTKMTDFCSSIAIDLEEPTEHAPKQSNGLPIKVIILDELEGGSDQFFKALRATIEKYAKNCRFIGTTNFINKIPEAIQSRFECICFDIANKEEEAETKKEWKSRLSMIFQKMEIEIDKDALDDLIEKNYPDLRSVLNKIQSFDIRGIKKISKEILKDLNWDFEELYTLMVSKPDAVKNYEFVMSNYSSMVDDVMAKIGDEFILWIKEKHTSAEKFIPNILITTALHQAQRTQVIDPIISLLSLFFSIQKILNQ